MTYISVINKKTGDNEEYTLSFLYKMFIAHKKANLEELINNEKFKKKFLFFAEIEKGE